MKIVVAGGAGLIGSRVVANLRARNHEVVAASTRSGVNTITREGLPGALAGADVVVDVTNSSSFDDAPALAFFERSTRNLLAVAADAKVSHYLALSVVGTDRLLESGYFRAKMAQETLIRASAIPYTILHSTQFFEFLSAIINAGASGDVIRVSPALIQPIAADDAARALADLAVGKPVNGVVEIAGPEKYRLEALASAILAADEDTRRVVIDDDARYFGAHLTERTLLPAEHPRFAPTRFEDWLRRSLAA